MIGNFKNAIKLELQALTQQKLELLDNWQFPVSLVIIKTNCRRVMTFLPADIPTNKCMLMIDACNYIVLTLEISVGYGMRSHERIQRKTSKTMVLRDEQLQKNF